MPNPPKPPVGSRTVMGDTYTPSAPNTQKATTSNTKPKTPINPKTPAYDITKDPAYIAQLEQNRILQEQLTAANAQAQLRAIEAEQQRAAARAERIDAFQILQQEMQNLGLSEFAPILQSYIQQDINPAVAPTLLEQTDVYKKRFIGNEARRAKGLPQLDMAGYLNAENDYRQLLKSNGLDALDSKETYAALIGGDVSLSEAQDRIEKVYNKIDTADAVLKENINKYFSQYGVSDPTIQKQQVASAILGGPERASVLQKSLQKAQLRAGAQLANVTVGEAAIEELQKQAESQNVADVYGLAKQGFSTLSQTQGLTEKLAQIYNEDITNLQPELQQEAFFGLASQRRKKLQEKEAATFSGKAGTSTVSLTQKSTAGQL